MQEKEPAKRLTAKQLLDKINTLIITQRRWSIITTVITGLATAVIAFGTIRYWITSERILDQMTAQTEQTQKTIEEMKESNKTMRDAHSETKKNNQILQTQLEIQIEQNFDEKLQLHYDLMKERDRIGKEIINRDSMKKPDFSLLNYQEYKFFLNRMRANYEALANLSKRYGPLGGRFARFAEKIPPENDLAPPSAPSNLRIKVEPN